MKSYYVMNVKVSEGIFVGDGVREGYCRDEVFEKRTVWVKETGSVTVWVKGWGG